MTRLKFGLYLPNFGDYSDPRAIAQLAAEAEAAGWEGVFLWDHLLWEQPRVQPVGTDVDQQVAQLVEGSG